MAVMVWSSNPKTQRLICLWLVVTLPYIALFMNSGCIGDEDDEDDNDPPSFFSAMSSECKVGFVLLCLQCYGIPCPVLLVPAWKWLTKPPAPAAPPRSEAPSETQPLVQGVKCVKNNTYTKYIQIIIHYPKRSAGNIGYVLGRSKIF